MSLFTVGYDASSTLGLRTGVGRAAMELLQAMVGARDEHFRFRVLLNSLRHSPGRDHAFLENERVQSFRTRRPGPWVVSGWAKGKGPDAESLVGAGIDLWHGPASYMPPVREAKRVVSVYDLAFLEDAPESRDRLGGALFADWFPRLLPECDRIVTSSEFSRARLIEEYGLPEDRVVVIHLGINHERFQPVGERFVEIARQFVGLSDKSYFMAVTGHAPRKRNALLLDTYEELLRRDTRTPKLLVVGWNGNPPAELRDRSHLYRNVVVADRVPDEHMPGLYTGSVVTVIPSRHEGFGLPVLEAMACGSPVVCAGGSALPEVGGEAACYVGSSDYCEWADAIARIGFDQARHDELGARGIEHVKPFTWESAAGQLLDLYANVAG